MPPLPQTLSLRQLEPHCVNPATTIRITNKLSLKKYYYRATIFFELDDPSSPLQCGRKPPLFLVPGPATFFSESLCPDSAPVTPSRSYR